MSAAVHSIISSGASDTIIDIECHLSNNSPKIIIVGFANKAVNEAIALPNTAAVRLNLSARS